MDKLRQKIAMDLLDAMDDASQSMFYVIQDGKFVYGNKHGCHITGLDPLKDVLGKPALAFVHPDDKPLLARMSRKVIDGESIQPFEWRLHTVDGRVVWVMGVLTRINFNGRPALFGNYIDITQIKQARSELQRTSKKVEELTVDLQSVREEERAQIAWELQENLSQTLEALRIELTDLFDNASPDNHSKGSLLHKIDSALDTITRISAHLTPPDIDHYDLAKAVRGFVNEFGDKTGIVLNFDTPRRSINFGKKQTVAVFHIFREMLKILAGLGRFKKIDILLQRNLHQLELRLCGKATGLKEDIGLKGAANPFNSLSERVKEWHGSLNIDKKKQRVALSALFMLTNGSVAHETRILFGSEQPILMEGIKQILASLPEFSISAQAETLLELIEKIKEPNFDVVLVDSFILGGQATDNLKKIKDASPYLPILVFHTTGGDDDFAVRILRHGASGYLSRSSSTNELISAIHKVAGGRKHISNRIAEKLAFEVDIYTPKPFHHRLSDRERQVMFMIAEGKTMREIASDLSLSYKTIATYRARVFEKMNMHTDTEIVRYAVSKGLV